jgi:hypothetical protein
MPACGRVASVKAEIAIADHRPALMSATAFAISSVMVRLIWCSD